MKQHYIYIYKFHTHTHTHTQNKKRSHTHAHMHTHAPPPPPTHTRHTLIRMYTSKLSWAILHIIIISQHRIKTVC